MSGDKQQRVDDLIRRIPKLTEGQIYWFERVVRVLEGPHSFSIGKSDLIGQNTLDNFGDALRIHHSFSAEPFSKDKFEYVLEKVLNMSGHKASLAPKGCGYDIMINNVPVSLKTQADKNIQPERIWISKFMELGKGKWSDNPEDLIGLRNSFLKHLSSYERIFTLRALQRAPNWKYELVEIPKKLMLAAKKGELRMQLESRQLPKPGYCYLRSSKGDNLYQLYFDAGSERKLQVKNLAKAQCVVHAVWTFLIPPE